MFDLIIYAGFGLIVGSFINAAAPRLYDGQSLLGRSACPSCGHTLAWYDLVPVLSFALLLGRCRYCGTRISALYPATEIVAAGVFTLIGLSPLPLLSKALALLIASLLVAIARYDLRHMLIPNAWVLAFNVLALLAPIFDSSFSLFGFFAGPALAAPFAALWLISRGRWMGLGDAKLALGIGWLLGLAEGALAILVAFVAGAIAGVLLIAGTSNVLHRILGLKAGNRVTMKSEIPFGPFLVFACLYIWILGMHGIPLVEELLVFQDSLLWNWSSYPVF